MTARDDLRDVVVSDPTVFDAIGRQAPSRLSVVDAVLDAIVAEAQRQGATHLSIPDLTGVVATNAPEGTVGVWRDGKGDEWKPYAVLRPLPDEERSDG